MINMNNEINNLKQSVDDIKNLLQQLIKRQ